MYEISVGTELCKMQHFIETQSIIQEWGTFFVFYGTSPKLLVKSAQKCYFSHYTQKQKSLQISNLQEFSHFYFTSWRRKRDSNPRSLAAQRFSRPPRSTTLPFLRRKDNLFLISRVFFKKKLRSTETFTGIRFF